MDIVHCVKCLRFDSLDGILFIGILFLEFLGTLQKKFSFNRWIIWTIFKIFFDSFIGWHLSIAIFLFFLFFREKCSQKCLFSTFLNFFHRRWFFFLISNAKMPHMNLILLFTSNFNISFLFFRIFQSHFSTKAKKSKKRKEKWFNFLYKHHSERLQLIIQGKWNTNEFLVTLFDYYFDFDIFFFFLLKNGLTNALWNSFIFHEIGLKTSETHFILNFKLTCSFFCDLFYWFFWRYYFFLFLIFFSF